MNNLVKKIIGRWQGGDGNLAEVVYEGSDDQNGIERWKAVDALKAPCIRLQTIIELEDGRRINFQINEIAHICRTSLGYWFCLMMIRKKKMGLFVFLRQTMRPYLMPMVHYVFV
jgi:hypothetical protein